jgi:Ca-activated chloride channel family protein
MTPDLETLTAYALGELTLDERVKVGQAIAADPEARARVEQIQALAALTEEALVEAPTLSERQRAAILARAGSRPTRRRWLWVAGTGAAAAATLLVGIGFLTTYESAPRLPFIYSLDGDGSAPALQAQSAPREGGEDVRREQLQRQLSSRLDPPMDGDTLENLKALGYVDAGPIHGEVAGGTRGATLGHGDGYFWHVADPDGQAEGNADPTGTESYTHAPDSTFRAVTQAPLSTFAVDVDTASYANVRRYLEQGRLPPQDAVRVEELINAFDYAYPGPDTGEPFSASVEVAACPWTPAHRLARIGLQARRLDPSDLPPSNLVLLIDTSRSMQAQAKLPLLKTALLAMVDTLRPEDRVAIVTYASGTAVALPSTPGSDRGAVRSAIKHLAAAGSTNGGAGISLAYEQAREHFVEGGSNRVLLATDGDFNVGITDQAALVELVQRQARGGVYLTVLGLGTGNLKDSTLERIADQGDGQYAYLDSLEEAERVLVRERAGTLAVAAKDVKVQVEFNPAEIQAWRLIGYENRTLAARDFDDDAKDAGEIGVGHAVTALYELIPTGAAWAGADLRYQRALAPTAAAGSGEIMTIKLRAKDPQGGASRLQTFAVRDPGAGLGAGSDDLDLAAAAACFGMLLRGSPDRGEASWDLALTLAQRAAERDPGAEREELVHLIGTARGLSGGGVVAY